jgi:hypothetical protein
MGRRGEVEDVYRDPFGREFDACPADKLVSGCGIVVDRDPEPKVLGRLDERAELAELPLNVGSRIGFRRRRRWGGLVSWWAWAA